MNATKEYTPNYLDMIKVKILCPYPMGQAPSQRFRFEQYLEFLEKNGVHTEVCSFLSPKGWALWYTKGKSIQKIFHLVRGCWKRFVLLFRLRHTDVVFIHREAAPFGPPIIEWCIAKVLKKKMVYDYDDAIWLPNYSPQHRYVHRIKAYWKVKYIIRWATHVTAGNAYLADYARGFGAEVTVIPTTIDLNLHRVPTPTHSTTPVLGWTGTHTTIRYLEELLPVLQRLTQEIPFKLHVISNEPPRFALPNLVYVPWNKDTEMEDLSQFTIGLMPLSDTEWAKGKCGFKALQYMALGIPTIASKVGVNKEIIQHGQNGYLAENLEEWAFCIRQILLEREAARLMAELGKRTVQQKYSVDANQGLYLQLFQSCN